MRDRPSGTSLPVGKALDLLAALRQEEAGLTTQLEASAAGKRVPAPLPEVGLPGATAATPAVAALMRDAAAAVKGLDAVVAQGKSLREGLAGLSVQAEGAASRLRALHGLRSRVRTAVDRVEDLLDLRACVSGVQVDMAAGDMDAAALHIKRFRGVEQVLPVPEGDVALMRDAEAAVLARVTSRFDETIAAASSSSSVRSEETNAIIARCCQLMNLLGHAHMGLARYARYLHATAAGGAHGELLALAASTGIEPPLAAVNALSAVLGRTVGSAEGAVALARDLFQGEGGPALVLQCLHTAVDAPLSRLLLSFVRSSRVAAALAARGVLAGGDELAGQADNGTEPGTAPLSAAESARLVARVESGTDEAPLAPLSPSSSSSPLSAAAYDSILDELAIALQRLSSYLSILAAHAKAAGLQVTTPAGVTGPLAAVSPDATAAAVESAAAAAAAGAGQPAASPSSASEVPRCGPALHRSIRELSSVFCALESAALSGGLLRAGALDEPLPDGAAGASLDLATIDARPGPLRKLLLTFGVVEEPSGDFGLGALLAGGSSATAADDLLSSSPGVYERVETGADCGAGAVLSTCVEDAVYVCQRAARRAFATGNADCVAAVLNAVVTGLTDRLCGVLEARLKWAIGGDVEGSSRGTGPAPVVPQPASGAPASAVDIAARLGSHFPATAVLLGEAGAAKRWEALRKEAAASGPVQAGAALLAAGGSSGRGGSSAGSGGDALGGSAAASSSRGDGGVGASGQGGAPGASPLQPRLSDDTVAVCLALNDVHLAALSITALRASLSSEAAATFSGAWADDRDAAKVAASLAGLGEVCTSLSALLESGITALASRLTVRLRTALNVFEGASSLVQYALTEDAYAAVSGGVNAFATEFLPVMASVLRPLHVGLTPPLAVLLLTRLAGYTARQLEARIRRKRFTAWGGIQFDADLRSLVGFFMQLTTPGVRAKFRRLHAIAAVLTAGSPEEVAELARGGSGVDALEPDEVKAVAGMRDDWGASGR